MQLLRLSCIGLLLWFTENIWVFLGMSMHEDVQVDPEVHEFIKDNFCPAQFLVWRAYHGRKGESIKCLWQNQNIFFFYFCTISKLYLLVNLLPPWIKRSTSGQTGQTVNKERKQWMFWLFPNCLVLHTTLHKGVPWFCLNLYTLWTSHRPSALCVSVMQIRRQSQCF